MKKIRLFIEATKIEAGSQIKITDGDFEYLTKVMRQKIGEEIFLFNGFDGEFKAVITQIERKFLLVKVLEKTSELQKSANITLAFAPVKNVRIDFVAAKATELGIATFQPILTAHTIVDKINFDRFKANIKEACEQCERNDFPQVLEIKKLEKILNNSENSEKIFILCDESKQGKKASEVLKSLQQNQSNKNLEIVILVGPEGGFSASEFARMREVKNLFAISLGPRILRADTAIISAITLVQEFLGDF